MANIKIFYKIFGVTLFSLVVSLFLLVGGVDAKDTHCCIYYKGAGPQGDCVAVDGDPNITVPCDDQKGYVPYNIMGAYTILSSESCASLSGYTPVKYLLSISGGGYNEWLCGAGQAIMKSAGSEGIGPALEKAIIDADVKIVQEKFRKYVEGLCCVPQNKTVKQVCHTPVVKGDASLENFLKEDVADTLVPDDTKYVQDISIWKYLNCGDGQWYHFNIGCTGDIRVGEVRGELNLTTLKAEQIYGAKSSAGAGGVSRGVLSASIFCSDVGGFCACKKDKSECLETFYKNQPACQTALGGLGGSSKAECLTVPLGTICTEFAKGSASSTPFPDLEVFNKLGNRGVAELIGDLMKTAMGIFGSIALIMFIYAGILWMTSMGNAEKEGKAFDILVWSSLGIMIILSSWALVTFVLTLFM